MDFSGTLLVLITMKVAGGHVHNSWGKSPALGLIVTALTLLLLYLPLIVQAVLHMPFLVALTA